ncbi:Mss4-like protein [Aspergillus pseudoustus]|uniref:Mss4-like protein n=1 Tax=Aspergillus pseudoustus TaxID=1810923 RepID=A0ABR4J8P9_9EURO
MTLSGSCLCGGINYTAEVTQYMSGLCHCTDCQKHTYTSNAVVPRASFKITKGTPSYYDSVGASGKTARRFFCSTCESSLYTDLEIMPDVTCIKGGKIDVEFYVKDRASYVAAVEGVKQESHFG